MSDASVLNTFMLVFETDGDKAVIKTLDKIDKAGKQLTKTNVETSKSAKTAAAGFVEMTRALAGAIAPALALGEVLTRTLNFAAQGEQLLFMAKSANMAADEFQKLAIASERFGGSREGAAGMMSGIASQIQALRLGQTAPLQNAAIFYGLNLQGANGALATGNELLRNIAATMERLDTAAQLDLGRRIGLDEATIRLLQRGVAAFDEEMARAEKRQVFRPEDLKRAQELEIATRDLKLAMNGLWAEIARWVMPAVQSLTEYATQGFEYLQEHSDAVKAALAGIAVVLGVISVESLSITGPWLATAAAIGLVVAGLALAYEDFKVWSEGGESALGSLWTKLRDFGDWWSSSTWADIALADFSKVGEAIKAISAPLGFVLEILNKIAGFIGGSVGWIVGKLTGGMPEMVDRSALSSVSQGTISNVANYDTSKISNMYNLTVNGAENPVQGGADLLNAAQGGFLPLTSGQGA